MKRMYLWSLAGVLLIGVLFISKDVREKAWSGLGIVGASAGLFSTRRVAAQAEAAPREKRPVPPIDAVIPATHQTATFALG